MLVPGGVTLPPRHGEDAGKVQTIGARFAHGLITLSGSGGAGLSRLRDARAAGANSSGTAATSQVVGEALGLRCRTRPWRRPGNRSGWTWRAGRRARCRIWRRAEIATQDILTDASIRNAMAVHAAFGGSTNLLLHIPAIAHAAGLRRPTVDDWIAVNRRVPRLVSVLPNGPVHHPTVRVFLAGGVPEVMLHLRRLGLLDETAC